MVIYQIYKTLETGEKEILCGAISKIKAELVLEEHYPEECGEVVWETTWHKLGKHRVYEGMVVK